MPTERTRIAPTPSGFLHEGNLLNFLLTARLADTVGAEITLRIDDMDVFRLRREYVEDIFRCLHWLGIEWQHGPRSIAEYEAMPSIEERADHYYDVLESMADAGLPVFTCACSRRELGRDARCERGCRDRDLELIAGETALRVRLPESAQDVTDAMGDFVVWRREDVPSYQLASVIDDHEMAMTHIMRGEDLRDSTLAQRYLAGFLPDSPFLRADIRHHPLIVGRDGAKLSKSQGTRRLRLDDDLRRHLDRLVDSTWDTVSEGTTR